nr:MAG TPA: hypothetical protein [Caudoviricetes sp.]
MTAVFFRIHIYFVPTLFNFFFIHILTPVLLIAFVVIL